MTSIYEVVTNLVRLARRFFKMGDEARSEKAREGIRSITENVGITGLRTQFPVRSIPSCPPLWCGLRVNGGGGD